MMGLMIIFIILSLLIVFAISTVFFKKPSTQLQQFNQQQLSSGIISSFLKTSSFCLQETDMEDLIIAVAKNNNLQCDPLILVSTSTCSSFTDSKSYLQCALQSTLDSSLGQFNMPYELKIRLSNSPENLIQLFPGNQELLDQLDKSTSGSVEPYILPLSGSTSTTVDILLCINSKCQI